MNLTRAAAAAGFVFVGLVLSVNVLLGVAGQPGVDSEPAEVARFFEEHDDEVGVAAAIAPLAWLMLIVFGAGAFNSVRERENGGAWAVVGIGGIVMQNAIFAGVVGSQLALRSAGTAGEDVTGMLWNFHMSLFFLNAMSLACALVGFSTGGLQTGVLPRWHGSLGLAAAGILVVAAMLTALRVEGTGGEALNVIGLVGFLAWIAWVTVFAALLWQRSREASPGFSRVPEAPA